MRKIMKARHSKTRAKLSSVDLAKILLSALGLLLTNGYVEAQADPVRELLARPGVILKVDRTTVGPGASIRLRLDNLGKTKVRYGNAFLLERSQAGRWIRLPRDKPFFSPLFELAPGEHSSWQVARVPTHSPPGVYRVSKSIEVSNRKVSRAATFRVG